MKYIHGASVKNLKKDNHLSYSELVYRILRKEIILGNLQSNTKLNEVDIAKAFKISATPVREAFRKLHADGLVNIVPFKGVTVKGISSSEVIAIYQCREVLEGLAAKLAAEKITECGCKKLKNIYNNSCNTADANAIVNLNREFHDVIINISGNEKIKLFINGFTALINRDMYLTSYDTVRSKLCKEEHSNILESILRHDPKNAEYHMRKHIANAFKYKLERDNKLFNMKIEDFSETGGDNYESISFG